ncbi:hypothetical protein C8R43DRAFT_161205 [Mycena crocata]|nr:hypothetical protein C8R43DRAFT_161205 [Mycena crocata]
MCSFQFCPRNWREIFEAAACSRPASVPKFMLVASHVKLWVEPLLYRTMFLPLFGAERIAGHPTGPGSKLLPNPLSEANQLLSFGRRVLIYGDFLVKEDVVWLLATFTTIDDMFTVHTYRPSLPCHCSGFLVSCDTLSRALLFKSTSPTSSFPTSPICDSSTLSETRKAGPAWRSSPIPLTWLSTIAALSPLP